MKQFFFCYSCQKDKPVEAKFHMPGTTRPCCIACRDKIVKHAAKPLKPRDSAKVQRADRYLLKRLTKQGAL